MSTKYEKGTSSPKRKGQVLGQVGNTGIPAKIFSDGSIEATAFIDETSSGLEFEELKLNKVGKSFLFRRKLDDNTSIEYLPAQVIKVFKTKVKKAFAVEGAFAKITGSVRRFITEELPRFKALPKPVKKLVREVHKKNQFFHFTSNPNRDDWSGEYWENTFIDSKTYGPYNYDVNLLVTKQLENMSDLLVVKTGGYREAPGDGGPTQVAGSETICWLSPAELVSYGSEEHHVYAGTNVTLGSKPDGLAPSSDETYWLREHLVVTGMNPHAVTSHRFLIPEGEILRSSVEHEYYDPNGGSPFTNTVNFQSAASHPAATFMWDKNSNRTFDQLSWDGVIPSGVWFRVETWSTNPRYIGFDGEISVVPVDSSVECSYSLTVEAEGTDENYERSISKARTAAQKKFWRGLNYYLIAKGVKNKNSKIKRYERMLERVAMNVYDGMTISRNEKIGEMVGTVVDPDDSPVFYNNTDGLYGGSKSNSNFDYSSVTKYKLKDLTLANQDQNIIYYNPDGTVANVGSTGGSGGSSGY